MRARILSQVVGRAITLAVTAAAMTMLNVGVQAQSPGYYTDPTTGIVYLARTRTVERPVVETTIQKKEQTVYRPQTVTETSPSSRTVYTPVVEYNWEPRMHGRWNPFKRPTIAYHHVPNTHWEPRTEVVQRTKTRTEWVAEKRTFDVPQRVVKMQREQKVDYQVVGQVATGGAAPAATNPKSEIASRLRPLESGTRILPTGQGTQVASSGFAAPRIAASTVGRMPSDPPRRSRGQGGLRATTLTPGPTGVRGQALPPAAGGTGVASLPSIPFFR